MAEGMEFWIIDPEEGALVVEYGPTTLYLRFPPGHLSERELQRRVVRELATLRAVSLGVGQGLLTRWS
jgi:hypothetical protein